MIWAVIISPISASHKPWENSYTVKGYLILSASGRRIGGKIGVFSDKLFNNKGLEWSKKEIIEILERGVGGSKATVLTFKIKAIRREPIDIFPWRPIILPEAPLFAENPDEVRETARR
ncbi:hypothetical protein UZ36_05900 [Candidatus Nitromaritima sp. SCGC AAA799-C22]|nr:hypothetical protein UZ36_05900 [Candidatus Nitromaritima sp. SCGC AAA799-C22]